MKVRKVDPDVLLKERQDAFLKLSPVERLAWLNAVQDRMRISKEDGRLKLIKKAGDSF